MSSGAGANDYYVFRHYNSDTDNTPEDEQGDNSNDTAATAELVGFNLGSGYVLGYIDPDGDVDYFMFNADTDNILRLACGASRSGSGLEGATFAIHDSSDNEIQAETEGDSADVYWASDNDFASMDSVALTPGEDYYLRVSATGQDANVSSNYYRCGLHPDLE
jgi:hypothetical protein